MAVEGSSLPLEDSLARRMVVWDEEKGVPRLLVIYHLIVDVIVWRRDTIALLTLSVSTPAYMSHQCGYCKQAGFPTLRGLRSHISQKPECRAASRRHAARAQAQSPVSTDDESTSLDSTSPKPSSAASSDDGGVDIPLDFPDPPLTPHSDMYNNQSPSPDPTPPPTKRARVEEVEDEEAGGFRHIKDYPSPAGVGLRQAETYFERVRREQIRVHQDVWAPYRDTEEWELAEWLARCVGHNQTDEFLKLRIVSSHLHFRVCSELTQLTPIS